MLVMMPRSKQEKLTLSASIKAPASIENSPVSSSLITAAVKPAALEALPDVYTERGINPHTYLIDACQIYLSFPSSSLLTLRTDSCLYWDHQQYRH